MNVIKKKNNNLLPTIKGQLKMIQNFVIFGSFNNLIDKVDAVRHNISSI